jgi:GMP synthase (glutamine-hydrolysing)
MKILLINNGTKHLGKLKDLLYPNELDIYPLISKYPNVNNYNLVVLSGGGLFSIMSAPEVFREEVNLIKSSAKPIIGICEGCEAIAYAFGAKLELSYRKTKGVRKIIPLINDSVIAGFDQIEVYEAHYWAITTLGKNLTGLAKSRSGYEIIKHKKRPIYGLQFHPEMLTNEATGDDIFRKIVSNITN